jgi:hypothetical protein
VQREGISPRGPILFASCRSGSPIAELVSGHYQKLGAIASGGVRVSHEDVVQAVDIPARQIDKVAEREQQELERREQAYRGEKPPVDIRGGNLTSKLPIYFLERQR